MPWSATADPDRFDEAVDWFRQRVPLTDELLEELTEAAQARAFRVAGVQQLDALVDVFALLNKAIEDGEGLSWWVAKAREKLENEWGRKDSFRLETIYRNNVQHAYNAGRWQQMQHPAVRNLRPFLMYDAVLDSRTSPICRPLDGTTLGADDEFWETHHPPLHHRCRSALRTLTRKQAERRGVTTDPDELPDGQDGWGDTPELDDWEPDQESYPPELWDIYERKLEEMTG